MADIHFDYSALGFEVEFSEREKKKILQIKSNPYRIAQKGMEVTPTSGNPKQKDAWMELLFHDILNEVRENWR